MFCFCTALHKKWSFSLRISSVNVIKSAVSYTFGHIYWRILNRKLHFCAVLVFRECRKRPVAWSRLTYLFILLLAETSIAKAKSQILKVSQKLSYLNNWMLNMKFSLVSHYHLNYAWLPLWPKVNRGFKIGWEILLLLISIKAVWWIFKYGGSKRLVKVINFFEIFL